MLYGFVLLRKGESSYRERQDTALLLFQNEIEIKVTTVIIRWRRIWGKGGSGARLRGGRGEGAWKGRMISANERTGLRWTHRITLVQEQDQLGGLHGVDLPSKRLRTTHQVFHFAKRRVIHFSADFHTQFGIFFSVVNARFFFYLATFKLPCVIIFHFGVTIFDAPIFSIVMRTRHVGVLLCMRW